MTDAIERAARAYDAARCASHGPGEKPMSERNLQTIMPMIGAALASLRPGDRITLADGTECWIAPMEATPAMRAAAVAADDRRTGNETCAHIFRAMRDACKEDEG